MDPMTMIDGSDDSDEELKPLPFVQSSSSVDSVASDSSKVKGVGELLNTSSFARRLAHGDDPSTERDPNFTNQSDTDNIMTAIEGSVAETNVEISSDVKRQTYEIADTTVSTVTSESEGGSGESMVEASVKTATESESQEAKEEPAAVTNVKANNDSVNDGVARTSLKASAYYSGPPPAQEHSDEAKKPFNAFSDYIAFFFNKAESYEQELGRQESAQNIQMNKTHHGSFNRQNKKQSFIEGRESSSSEDGSVDDNINETAAKKEATPEDKSNEPPRSPTLTESEEALAAVDAISNFRSLTDSRREMKEKHSFNAEEGRGTQKKQKVANEASREPSKVADKSMKEMWKNNWEIFVVGKKKERFPEVAIERLALPLSVDEFAQHVLKDNAVHSIGNFMRDIGELEVSTTLWKPHITASEASMRTIDYTHPVNAPMAPPQAKARKHQCLHKFGSVGLCVETRTVVEEVPMADCFVVNDRLWVQEAEGDDGWCVVSVTYQIKFVKSTMFRRIIENATRKEYGLFYDQFDDMIGSLKSPPSPEEEGVLEEVALELEEATMELEQATAVVAGEGTEVSLSSALSRIRRSSRRLSVAAKLPESNRALEPEVSEDKPGIDAQRVLVFALDGIAYIRKKFSESDNRFAVACAVILFLVLLNLVALKQMMMMNRFLYNLDARLGRMNELNEGLLLKLASGNGD